VRADFFPIPDAVMVIDYFSMYPTRTKRSLADQFAVHKGLITRSF
jgi:hypothetical protein